MSGDVLLTAKEYAALFKVNVSSVYTAIRQHRIPYPLEQPLGRSVKIRVPRETYAKLKAA